MLGIRAYEFQFCLGDLLGNSLSPVFSLSLDIEAWTPDSGRARFQGHAQRCECWGWGGFGSGC